jgi:hypothetical protein
MAQGRNGTNQGFTLTFVLVLNSESPAAPLIIGFLDIFSESVTGNLEFASHEVNHREQVLRGSIATSFSLRDPG